MASQDNTKELLEQLLSQLYSEQAKVAPIANKSYLSAQDGQFLGKITDNIYDNNSIMNEYGPFGSPYSNTSIFNPYSPYGSDYGAYSINNPYCSVPPKLFINGQLIGHVTTNSYVHPNIPAKAFLYTLKNDLTSLLQGRIIQSAGEARKLQRGSFIEAQDGTFLGKLTPNQFDSESIFNNFGPYGNKFSQSSIFNKFSNYGSQFSNLSPYNQFSQTPPKVYLKGKFVAYLTVNKFLSPRIDPNEILDWAQQHVSRLG